MYNESTNRYMQMQIFLVPEKVMVTLQPQMLIIWLVLADKRDGSALKERNCSTDRRDSAAAVS